MKKNTNPVLLVVLAAGAGIVGYVVSSGLTSASLRSGNMSMIYLLFIGLAVLIGGIIWWALRNNRSVSTASDAERQAILGTPPAAGYGRVLIYRDGFVGKLAGLDILLDGQTVAQLKSPRFVALDLPPATYGIAVSAQGKRTDPLQLALSAGEVAVVKAAMILGGVAVDRDPNPDSARARMAGIPMVHADSHAAAAVFA